MCRTLIDLLMDSFGDEIRTIHELKICPQEYAALASKAKRHEVRRCDRDFQVGDWLLLRYWDPETEEYNDQQLFREITHITPAGTFGLPDDLCVLSVR